LFNEVAYVWPRVGYPPLVTPFSQYVKNIALMNLLSESMDEPRFTRMDDNMWGMILGKSGKLPGELAPEIKELAKKQGREFTEADPQSFYPDKLDEFREEMKKNNWEAGPDDEELFELAMHPEQYRDFKSGAAKHRFEQELANAKMASLSKGISAEEVLKVKRAKYTPIVATQRGQIFWEIDVDSTSNEPAVGRKYEADDTFCYVMTPWGSSDEMKANFKGKIVEICVKQGERVNKGDVLAYIEEA
jgi:pyruvate carboxylase subunit B